MLFAMIRSFCFGFNLLTHWDWDKMASIGQTTFLNAFSYMKMYKFQLRFHWNLFPKGPINNITALVQIMVWRRPGDKPLSESMMVSLLTHICVSRPQWVNVAGISSQSPSFQRTTMFSDVQVPLFDELILYFKESYTCVSITRRQILCSIYTQALVSLISAPTLHVRWRITYITCPVWNAVLVIMNLARASGRIIIESWAQ